MSNRFLNLIPLPQKITCDPGIFQVSSLTALLFDPELGSIADYLQTAIQDEVGVHLPSYSASAVNAIILKIDASISGISSYRLKITPNEIHLCASTQDGIFHAAQTLLQILFQSRENLELPCRTIEDSPRFSWRGFMLDEARHFQGMTQVKRILDMMARLKMNVFHWHLTDDQGWRIEIQKYPRLTETGSKRAGTSYGFTDRGCNHISHSGFYTQSEIREILDFAADRKITIVPEIEFPGHATAALAAYPEYSCTGGPFQVATHWGIFPEIYCAGKEETFTFLQNILAEVMQLFPGKYIHIGGDEAPKKRWKHCPFCRQKAAELEVGIDDLQPWFANRLTDTLSANNRLAIGWSETLRASLNKDTLVQHWLPQKKKMIEALQQGRKVILSPYLDVYLDHTYEMVSLRHLYEFEPVLSGLDAQISSSILGLEAPLWSEYVWNQPRLDYQLFPRLFACAELGWTSPAQKDYQDFKRRTEAFLPWLKLREIAYAPLDKWNPPQYKRILSMLTLGQPKNQISSGKIPFPR